jgi:hypothetical protein
VTSFALPFLTGGGSSVKFGELAVADERRLGSLFDASPTTASAENDCAWELGVGLPGADEFERGGVAGPLPDAASVRRNSTHSRENDCQSRM